MRFGGKTVLAIHEGQTDTAMVRGPQVAKRAALRLALPSSAVPFLLPSPSHTSSAPYRTAPQSGF